MPITRRDVPGQPDGRQPGGTRPASPTAASQAGRVRPARQAADQVGRLPADSRPARRADLRLTDARGPDGSAPARSVLLRFVYCLGTVDNMALDASLLEQAKTAEAHVIDAEHEAEVARAEFHRAVRRLQLAGGSLREIADALGLSHQRVHQIVESAGGSRRWRARRSTGEQVSCSFCGREQKRTKILIGGPGAFICDRCIPQADAALATEGSLSFTSGRMQVVSEDARAVRCNFCGKCRYQ